MDGCDGYNIMRPDCSHMVGIQLGFEGFVMIIFWILLILIVVGLIRALIGASSWNNTRREEDEALRILRERYAKGEITKEEYRERKNDLMIK